MRYISGTKLDERVIRCDLDPGYREGRQFGRGRSGGQVRDEHRTDFDAGRGGWGAQAQRAEAERRRREEVEERYKDVMGGGSVAGGGEEWKAAAAGSTIQQESTLKRARSPEVDDTFKMVRVLLYLALCFLAHGSSRVGCEQTDRKTKNQNECNQARIPHFCHHLAVSLCQLCEPYVTCRTTVYNNIVCTKNF